ncbi:MAG: hypothetical protein C0407_17905, partial [Desulfobacca sp.]|nr:hypothetical protein [Desulfobacca sp.]
SKGVDQISKAIQQLDKVIQQNAAAAEQMSSTSATLSGQAEQLQGTIGFFQIGDTGGSARKKSLKLTQKPAAALIRPRDGKPAAGSSGNGKDRGSSAGFALEMGKGRDSEDEQYERY